MSDKLCLDCSRVWESSNGECSCGTADASYSIDWTASNIEACQELSRSKADKYVANLVKVARDAWCDDCEAVTTKQLTGFAQYYNKKEYECAACAKKREEDGPSDDQLANGFGVEGGISYAGAR